MEPNIKTNLCDITYLSELTPPSKRNETGGRTITTKPFPSMLSYQAKSIEGGVKFAQLTYVTSFHKSSAHLK